MLPAAAAKPEKKRRRSAGGGGGARAKKRIKAEADGADDQKTRFIKTRNQILKS